MKRNDIIYGFFGSALGFWFAFSTYRKAMDGGYSLENVLGHPGGWLVIMAMIAVVIVCVFLPTKSCHDYLDSFYSNENGESLAMEPLLWSIVFAVPILLGGFVGVGFGRLVDGMRKKKHKEHRKLEMSEF